LLIIKVAAPEKTIVVLIIIKLGRHIFDLENARRLDGVRLELLAESVLLLLENTVRNAGGGNLVIIHRKIFIVQVFLNLFA